MGGDNAPRAEVEGAVMALGELPPSVRIQLVGRTADIEAALKPLGEVDRSRLDIVEAPEVVGMGEKPLAAIKSKRGSSIAVGLGLQKQGRSDAFLSAGNTGAVMAGATLLLCRDEDKAGDRENRGEGEGADNGGGRIVYKKNKSAIRGTNVPNPD